jgi:hypothetical protein
MTYQGKLTTDPDPSLDELAVPEAPGSAFAVTIGATVMAGIPATPLATNAWVTVAARSDGGVSATRDATAALAAGSTLIVASNVTPAASCRLPTLSAVADPAERLRRAVVACRMLLIRTWLGATPKLEARPALMAVRTAGCAKCCVVKPLNVRVAFTSSTYVASVSAGGSGTEAGFVGNGVGAGATVAASVGAAVVAASKVAVAAAVVAAVAAAVVAAVAAAVVAAVAAAVVAAVAAGVGAAVVAGVGAAVVAGGAVAHAGRGLEQTPTSAVGSVQLAKPARHPMYPEQSIVGVGLLYSAGRLFV